MGGRHFFCVKVCVFIASMTLFTYFCGEKFKSNVFIVNDMEKIRVVTLCSGYDAQCLSLERLRRDYPAFDYELVAWAEIDRYAIAAHDALFPRWCDRNMGDITSCDWSVLSGGGVIDLLTYSTPCTSISSAGRQEGLKRGSGTASSIIWSVLNAIDVLRPRILLMENVKALVSRKFIGDFHEWQQELSKRGYSNFAKVLNSKDFGVPQNRERVFMVSILDYDGEYHFPAPFPLDRHLVDVLEEDVDEKYFLSEKIISTFNRRNKLNASKGNGFKFEPKDGACVASAILSSAGSRPCDNFIKVPAKLSLNVVGNRFASGHSGGKVYGVDGIAPTVMFNNNNSVAIVDPQCLTMRRTELGREARRAGEKEKFSDKAFEPRNDGICNTLTSVPKDNLVVEPFNPSEDGTCRTLKAQYYKNGMANFKRSDGLGATAVAVSRPKIIQRPRGFNSGGEHKICPTISSSSFQENNFLCDGFLIRKLTERECFRLQGVDDADIDKIQAAGISRSQQYKMAGNSITVDVLYHIFRKLFIDKGNENRELTLF